MKPHPLVAQLIEEREALDFTRQEAADAAGLAKATIAMAETGHRTPSLESLETWAKSLGFTVTLIHISERYCRECKEIKPETAFGRDRRTRDGIATRCGACVAANPTPLPRRLGVAA